MTTYLFDKYSEMDDEEVEENDSDDKSFDDIELRLFFLVCWGASWFCARLPGSSSSDHFLLSLSSTLSQKALSTDLSCRRWRVYA